MSIKSPQFVIGLVIFVVTVGLVWNYTEAVKAKNQIDQQKIASDERIKAEELRQKQEQSDRDQAQQEAELIAKKEADQKEFASNRKTDCLNIYKTENSKWTNVRGWRYDEFKDKCWIKYKNSKPMSEAECDKEYPIKESDGGSIEWLLINIMCKDGEFENSF